MDLAPTPKPLAIGQSMADSSQARAPDSDVPTEIQTPKSLLRASTSFYGRVITDWWWWELGSWLVSFACVATIIGLLLYYDGKKQPNYVIKGITLNAFIAVFAAIAKAALILPVSEAIGQLKWLWFRENRTLFDFYAFDNASRGPWGAASLLCNSKGRHLVSLGAVITVLALAFEPFFQQSVSYPSRNVVIGTGAVSVAITHGKHEVQYPNMTVRTWANGAQDIASRLLASRIDDAISSRNASSMQAPSICPTGRCSWPPYSSLGVCHRCQNVSHLLVPECEVDSIGSPEGISGFQFPCGHRLNDTLVTGLWGYWERKAMGLSTMLLGSPIRADSARVTYWNSTAFRDASNVLVDFYIGYLPGEEPQIERSPVPTLMECVFQWCVRTYEAFHSDGLLEERVLSTYLPPDGNAQRSTRDDGFMMTAAGKTFTVEANTSSSVRFAINSNLPTWLDNTTLDSSGQYPGKWSFVQTAPHDVNLVMGSIADAVTTSMRSQTNEWVELVSGDAWGPEPFVKMQWLWILLPSTLLLATLVLICGTIIKSQRQRVPAWKSSALATLLYGLSEEARGQLAFDVPQSEVEAVARKLRVQLLVDQSAPCLVAVAQRSNSQQQGCLA